MQCSYDSNTPPWAQILGGSNLLEPLTLVNPRHATPYAQVYQAQQRPVGFQVSFSPSLSLAADIQANHLPAIQSRSQQTVYQVRPTSDIQTVDLTWKEFLPGEFTWALLPEFAIALVSSIGFQQGEFGKLVECADMAEIGFIFSPCTPLTQWQD